jgi:porin
MRVHSFISSLLLSLPLTFASVRCGVAGPLCAQCDEDGAMSMSATYTGEMWRETSGGLGRGTAYLDNLDFTLDVDASRAFGWAGVELFAYAIYNNGHELCSRLAGSMQCVSNIEENHAARVFELWSDWTSASKHESVRFGLYDVNSEFDSIGSAQIFINPSQGIGPDFAQSGHNGPSIFPVTSLGIRAKKLWGPLEFKVAVLDAVPGDPEHPQRTTIKLSNSEGALVVAEMDRQAAFLRGSRIAAGYWRYTSELEQFATTTIAIPRKHESSGAYLIVESPALFPAGPDEGLNAYVRLGWAEPQVNAIEHYLGSGMAYRKESDGLERSFGLAVGIAELGSPYRQSQDVAGVDSRKREYCYEMTSRWAVSDRVVLQPDVQYIVHPGMDRELDDGWIIGLRVEISALALR